MGEGRGEGHENAAHVGFRASRYDAEFLEVDECCHHAHALRDRVSLSWRVCRA
jgi:hypothetical protein